MSEQKVIDLTQSTPSRKRKADALLAKLVEDSIADTKKRTCDWPLSPDWPGVPELGKKTGVQFITAVDPGEVNLGAWRVQLYPEFKATHVKILDLHEICTLRNSLEPEIKIGHSKIVRGKKRYGTRAILDALAWYVNREIKDGGLFDSQMLFVESQDFKRNMKGIETVLVSIFNSHKQPIYVHPQEGGSRRAGQVVSANSAKSCYAGLFPSVADCAPADEYEELERSGTIGSSRKKRRFHGHGDVQSSAKKVQYAANKRHAKLHGPNVALAEKLRDLVPLSKEDYQNLRSHISANKTDDIYDAMFIALYAINTHIYQMYRYKKSFISKPLSAVHAPPLRKKRQFEELYEFATWAQSNKLALSSLHSALFK